MGKYISNFTHEQMREMAKLRASGLSWNAVGAMLEHDPEELENLTWRRSKEWEKYLRYANKAVINEALAESVFALRKVLRNDDNERLRVMASNSLVRLWHTQNPKRPKVKKKKEKELTPRQKFFHNKADQMASLTDEELRDREIRDAERLFAGRLATYLKDDPELYERVKEAANLDERGIPKDSKMNPDPCRQNSIKQWNKSVEGHPEWRQEDDEYIAEQAEKELKKEEAQVVQIPIPGSNETVEVLRGTIGKDEQHDDEATRKTKPPHGFNMMASILLLVCSTLLLPFGMAHGATAQDHDGASPIALKHMNDV